MMFSPSSSLDGKSALSPSSAWRIKAGRSDLSLRLAGASGAPDPPKEFMVRSGLLRIEGDRLYLRFALTSHADAHRPQGNDRTQPIPVEADARSAAPVGRSEDLLDGAVVIMEAFRTSQYGSVEEFSGLLRCDEGRAHIHAVTTRSSIPFVTEGADCFALTFQAESRFTFRWPDAAGELASGRTTDVVGMLRLEAVPVWAPVARPGHSRPSRVGQAGDSSEARTA